MSESPDFEEWARQVYAGVVLMRGMPDLADGGERMARLGIANLLRQIWNARGAADTNAVTGYLNDSITVDMAAIIQALDR